MLTHAGKSLVSEFIEKMSVMQEVVTSLNVGFERFTYRNVLGFVIGRSRRLGKKIDSFYIRI